MSDESNIENNCSSVDYFEEIIDSRNLEKIKSVAEICGVNTPNEIGTTLLAQAVSVIKEDKELIEIVNILLEMGGDPVFTIDNEQDQTQIYFSAINIALTRQHVEIVKMMIDKANLDVNSRANDNQPTYLATACASCNIDMVKMLIEKGADANKKSYDVFSLPIIMSVEQERKLETPLHICLKTYFMLKRTHIFGGITDEDYKKIEETILEIIKILLENGAFPDGHNDENKESHTIQYANKRGLYRAMVLLIENGAAVTNEDIHAYSNNRTITGYSHLININNELVGLDHEKLNNLTDEEVVNLFKAIVKSREIKQYASQYMMLNYAEIINNEEFIEFLLRRGFTNNISRIATKIALEKEGVERDVKIDNPDVKKTIKTFLGKGKKKSKSKKTKNTKKTRKRLKKVKH